MGNGVDVCEDMVEISDHSTTEDICPFGLRDFGRCGELYQEGAKGKLKSSSFKRVN